MHSIIKKLDGNAKVKVTVIEGGEMYDSNGKPVTGKTTDYDFTDGIFKCTIKLNETILISATQEFVATTIIHEAIHAYMQFNAGNTTLHNQNHEQISTKYIVPMVNFLTSIYPSLNAKDATAMFWGGLQQTNLWKDSFKNDAFKIGKTNETMSFDTMKGLENAHAAGYAENSTPLCPPQQ